jgi:hypothetical protein
MIFQMSERLRFHEGNGNAPPPPPPGPQYPHPYYIPPHPEYESYLRRQDVHKGLRLIFFGLILYILGLIFDSFWIIMVYPVDYYIFSIFLAILAGISYFSWILFFILTVAGIIILQQSKNEFGEKHSRYLRYAMVFLIAFFILFVTRIVLNVVASFSFFFFGRTIYAVILSLTSILGNVSAFMLVFIVFLPAIELAGGRERDKLYVFATMAITLVVLNGIVSIMIGTAATDESFMGFMYLTLFLNFLSIITWAIAASTYHRLWHYAKYYAQEVPRKTPKLLPRPRPLSDYIYKFYSRPVHAIVILAVVALLMGTAQGAALTSFMFQDDNSRYSSDTYEVQDEEVPELPGNFFIEGYLDEGQEEDFTYYINEDVGTVEALLSWEDESVRFPSENAPDKFTVVISIGGKKVMESSESDSDGNGYIQVSMNVFEQARQGYDDVEVVVTMDEAGDVNGPIGLGIGPFSEVDTGNSYYLNIVCS